RRRHTRWPRDWSSDVCSSDLEGDGADTFLRYIEGFVISGYIVYLIMVIYIVNSVISLLRHIIQVCSIFTNSNSPSVAKLLCFLRSEERRVGKECRFGLVSYTY